MSTMNPSDTATKIQIPPPPVDAGTHKYYMVYGEWMQFVQVGEQHSIVTLDNPNPSAQGPQVLRRSVGLNEVIDIPPIFFAVLAQGQRPGYQIKWAMAITKQQYEWYKKVEKVMEKASQQAAEASQNNGNQA